MKTFIPNKKWALTGALLTVLAVNVSFNNHKYGIAASADFSSSELATAEAEFETAQGKQSVKYIQIEENKVLALKKDTEGKVCYNCEARSFTLENSNIKDLEQLNIKYVNALTRLPTKEGTVDREDINSAISQEILDKVLAACSKKEGSQKLTCLSSKFLKTLKSKGGSLVTEEEATKFFDEEIAPLIEEQIKLARNTAVKQFRNQVRAQTGGAPYYLESEFADFEDDLYNDGTDGDGESILQEALEVVKELHGEVPKKFTDIRKQLVTTQKKILEKHSQDIRTAMKLAYEKRNTVEGNIFNLEASLLKEQMLSTASQMKDATKGGLMDAYTSQLISKTQANEYYQAHMLASNGLTNSMRKFYDDWVMTGNPPLIGDVNSLPAGVDFSGRLSGATRGGVVVVPQSGAISNRGALNLSSSSAAPALDANGNLVWVIPTNNTGIEFGTVSPLTDTNRAFVEQMRQNMQNNTLVIQRGN